MSSRNTTLEFSSAGSIILDGNNQATAGAGLYGAIQVLKDSTLSNIAGTSIQNIGFLNTPLQAGTILYGRFTNVTVGDGGLVAVHKF